MFMTSLRPATIDDLPALCALDQIASRSEERREFIRQSIAAGACLVAESPSKSTAGYGVLTHSFFRHSFVEMLYIASEFRRQGFGTALLKRMAELCRTSKLFASANLSNAPMRSLLVRERFVESGIIHNLDNGDPEIIYVKQLRAG